MQCSMSFWLGIVFETYPNASFLFREIKFSRLDGSMHFVDRQKNIDRFSDDPNYRIFLLSTRAGGKYIFKLFIHSTVDGKGVGVNQQA